MVMFLTAIMAVALGGSALIDEFDRRNLAYTQCIFAEAREARVARLDAAAMLVRVDNACRAEADALGETLVAARIEQGDSRGEAEAQWQQLQATSRAALRRAYQIR